MLNQPKTLIAVVFCASGLFWTPLGPNKAYAVVPSLKSSAHGKSAAEIGELHKAKAILEKADHDYDGHRVKAIEDIDKAIHALHHHSAAAGKSKAPESKVSGKSEGSRSKVAQKKSDEELHEAAKILEAVEKQLHEKHAKGGGEHHAKAAKDVKRALEQLHDALKIR